jgi:hypothetical protein
MHVQDGREAFLSVDGLDDADPDVADLGRNGDPLLGDVELGDRGSLNVVENLARAVGAPELPARGSACSCEVSSFRIHSIDRHDRPELLRLTRRSLPAVVTAGSG